MILWQPGVLLEEVEKKVILAALQFYHGNKTHAAKSLGISLRSLRYKVAEYTGEKLEPEELPEAPQPIPLRENQPEKLSDSPQPAPAAVASGKRK